MSQEKMEYQLLRRRDAELQKQLEKVDWPIEFGTITVTIKEGAPTLTHVDRTVIGKKA